MIDLANLYQVARELLISQGKSRPGDLEIWQQVFSSLDKDSADFRYLNVQAGDPPREFAPVTLHRIAYGGFVIVLKFEGARFSCCYLDENIACRFDSIEEMFAWIQEQLKMKKGPPEPEPEDTGPSFP
ncbi:MAG: hypothetical protein RIB30_09845 [Thalassospira sp.]|uniref:hypothetical protein n=1 Tax=Thalassospira sp. TaxID=1912094 RepID=UPI0032EB3B1C